MSADDDDEEDTHFFFFSTTSRGGGGDEPRRRKKFKMNLKNKKNFFVPYALCALAFEGFCVLSFVLASDVSDKLARFVGEVNSTARAEQDFSFANNVFRQLLLNSSFPIVQECCAPRVFLNASVDDMYWLVSGIQKEHAVNIQAHS